MYADGEYDLAGFAVGAVDRSKIIDGRTVAPGDVLIGLASTGLHSNGYSLARRVLFEQANLTVTSRMPELDRPVGEVLLTPTRIYAKQVLTLIQEYSIKGIAHITGGGITENLPRVFPPGVRAQVERSGWNIPPIFDVIAKLGAVTLDEMYRVFNMGIGLILVVPPDAADAVMQRATALGDRGYRIGSIMSANDGGPLVEYVE
jgi:phosphoribosylformylglycinamidine cyclo-ligase